MSTSDFENLPGYNRDLEERRQKIFSSFLAATHSTDKRRYFSEFAKLTLKRKPEFIAALERSRELIND